MGGYDKQRSSIGAASVRRLTKTRQTFTGDGPQTWRWWLSVWRFRFRSPTMPCAPCSKPRQSFRRPATSPVSPDSAASSPRPRAWRKERHSWFSMNTCGSARPSVGQSVGQSVGKSVRGTSHSYHISPRSGFGTAPPAPPAARAPPAATAPAPAAGCPPSMTTTTTTTTRRPHWPRRRSMGARPWVGGCGRSGAYATSVEDNEGLIE